VSTTTGDPGVKNEWQAVIRAAVLSSSEKLVAHTLATYANPDGSSIFPGIARLAIETKLSYRTVQRALKKLRDVGLIQKVRYGASRLGQSDEYRLVPIGEAEVMCEVRNPAQTKLAMKRIAESQRGSSQWRRERFAGHQHPAKIRAGSDALPVTSDRQSEFCRSPETVLPVTGDPPPSIDPEIKHHPPSDEASLRTTRTGCEPLPAGTQNDNRPSPRTREQTAAEAARQAVALNEWMRQHPEAAATMP
jgi:hypothetical protein